MYAVIKTGGKQYRVCENDVINIEKLAASEGDTVEISEVLLVSRDDKLHIGSPYVPGAKVSARVLKQTKGPKIRGFTYKPKKDVRRRYGHRQRLTSIKIEKISVG